MTPAKTLDIKSVERFLEVRGWKPSPYTHHAFISADSAWEVELDVDGGVCTMISINQFTDSDVPNDAYKGGMEARARYETVGNECYSVDELRDELYSLGAMPFECPDCGDAGGEPRTATSEPYLYGVDADGNRGEMRTETFEGCSKCIKTYWRD
jgi:hypothetical protein